MPAEADRISRCQGNLGRVVALVRLSLARAPSLDKNPSLDKTAES
jgi:hypothetical protein